MTILYILLIMVICITLITALQIRSAHRKELNDLMELFDDSSNT
ncbi:MAG: hypothetical protein OEM46_10215 [Ignavibacteria bacterium]|nr:hypothetical protein [Ignavibacteria bacterium]